MTSTTCIGVHDQNLEKHMGGCMASFFNIFDRSHRLYPKRLPPSLPSLRVEDVSSDPVSSVGSPALSREFEKPKNHTQPPQTVVVPDPVVVDPPKSPLAVSTFEFKEGVKSPWKFTREAPRLSLDSRAVVDAKGGLRPREIRINTAVNSSAASGDEERENQRRSPSVIARLMGLDRLPSSSSSVPEPENKVELRRSASESRSRDYRFFDTGTGFISPTASKTEMVVERKSDQFVSNRAQKINSVVRNNSKPKNQNLRKSYYDTADFFPPEIPAKYQHHQNQAVTIFGEIEKRLRMRGIDEPTKDLDTLKNILEALQLKGLLHSSSAVAATTKPRQNLVFDRREESPIVVMKPARPPPAGSRRRVNGASGEPTVSPRRERPARSAVRSPGRSENRNSSQVVRRKEGPLSIETRRSGSESTTTRGLHSPVQSPRMTRRSDQTVNRSPRNRRSTVEIRQGERERLLYNGGPNSAEDEASTLSECSFSTSSHTDNERWRVEEYREGRNLLERCDKLLNSIAEMNLNLNSNSNSNSIELQQPSPVSVLDPSFYKEDESSPSPVKKRTIDFKDQVLMEMEDDMWSPSSSSQILSKPDHDFDSSDDSDFCYVSEVFRASNYLTEDVDIFLLLEKQTSMRGNGKSEAAILQRKLIFDTITEILDRNRQLPPWKAVSISNWGSRRPTLDQIWSEFRKIREQGRSEDPLEFICGVLKKDLAGDSINGWGDCHVEMSEAVLDIERLIFKDLIGETIRDLASLAGKSMGNQALRRKLVF